MPHPLPVDHILEDLTFLAEHHVGANEAAHRTGFRSVEALEKWLDRHQQRDLWHQLRRHDPASTYVQPRQRCA